MKRTLATRRGTMLVEVMMCMVIGMILISVITTVFVRVVVMDPAAREHLATTTTLGRLAEQFRHDVHAALDATPSTANPLIPLLSLQGPGDLRIEYEPMADGLRRTRFDGDNVLQREHFALGDMKVIGWEVQKPSREVSMVLGRLSHRDSDDAATVRYQFPITARLARDHRFARVDSIKDPD
jgi:hypothetical protein